MTNTPPPHQQPFNEGTLVPPPTLNEALDVVVRAAGADAALRSMISARLGFTDPALSTNSLPVPLPSIHAMNAVQAAIFDNWPNGKRVANRPNRYGMAIEIWTEPPERIKVARRESHQHKVNVALLDSKALGAWAKKMLNTNAKRLHPLDPAFLDGIAGVAGSLGTDEFAGVCAAKTAGVGTVYFDHQWVFVALAGVQTHAILCTEGDKLLLPTFSRTAPNGDKLGDGVILHKAKNKNSFRVTAPNGTLWTKAWNYNEAGFKKLEADDLIYWGKTGIACPQKKVYLKPAQEMTKTYGTMIPPEKVGYTGDGGKDLAALGFDKTNFIYAKPVALIEHLLEMASTKNARVLDFFAGSGTTGQAVMSLNARDGGTRTFVLCNSNENDICRTITLPRVVAAAKELGVTTPIQFGRVEVDDERFDVAA